MRWRRIAVRRARRGRCAPQPRASPMRKCASGSRSRSHSVDSAERQTRARVSRPRARSARSARARAQARAPALGRAPTADRSYVEPDARVRAAAAHGAVGGRAQGAAHSHRARLVLRAQPRQRAAARRARARDHLRVDGRDQHGARRDADARRLLRPTWCRRCFEQHCPSALRLVLAGRAAGRVRRSACWSACCSSAA